MKLSDLRDWIEDKVSSLGLKVEYNIGRYVATNNNQNDILISIKQGSGRSRPPFIRYNRYTILIISGQMFMSPESEDGADIDFREDDPMSAFGVVTKSFKPTSSITGGVWDEGEMIANYIELASDSSPPCNASGIKLLSSKAGPLYLDDGRIYYTLDLEIII